MKTPTILILLALCGSAAAGKVPVPSVPMTDQADSQSLSRRFARANKPMKRQDPRLQAPVGQPAQEAKEKWKPQSILERSEFLSSNGVTTLVPKGSLLNVPPRYRDRVKMGTSTKIVRWAEFLKRNRNWISTYEVSRAQAEAVEPIEEEDLESIRKNPLVVVATLDSGPITVLKKPPATPATPATESAGTGDSSVASSPTIQGK